MKTTRIYNILLGELYKRGYNYYRDEKTNKIVYLSDDSLMQKILSYDPIVDDIVSIVFFNNNYLNLEEADIAFKYLWTSEFLNREIKYQTLELFSAKNTSLFYQYANIILAYFRDFDKYLTNTSETETTGTSNSTNTQSTISNKNDIINSNSIVSTLPQTEINMDLNNDTLTYADNNNISKTKNNSNSNTDTKNHTDGENIQKSSTRSYDISKLVTYTKTNILQEILNDFDKKCFLQTW